MCPILDGYGFMGIF